MKGQNEQDYPTGPHVKPSEILTNWLLAAELFYRFYNQINSTLDALDPSQTKRIGQCSISQLISLRHTMQTQLEKLLLEANQPGELSIPSWYKVVADHTQLLSQLNQQAIMCLELASLPSG